MRLLRLLRDRRGTTAVEFGLIAPAFFGTLLGACEVGLLLWTQTTLQHATEMAARCASVNTAICGSATATQTYAASQVLGWTAPASAFSVTTPSCGNQVTATYDFVEITALFGLPKITLNAKSCFPK